MAIERERKFLVKDNSWRELAGAGVKYRQGYIYSDENKSIRIRISNSDALLNIKSGALEGDATARLEYEYAIPLSDAEEMLENLCGTQRLEKTRYKISYEGNIWEVDEFSEANQGLVMAEVEFEEKNQSIKLPLWIGEEVTEDKRYTNAELAKKPYIT